MSDLLNIERIPFWPFVLFLLLSGTVLYIRAINISGWKLMFRSTYNSRATAQLMREENMMDNTNSAVLVFIFFFSIALLFFNVQKTSAFGLLKAYPILLYVLILFLLFIFFILKFTVLYLLQLIFQQKELFHEYFIVFMNINIVLGIWLIPLNLFFTYGVVISHQKLSLIGAALTVFSFLLLNVRVFEIGIRNRMKWYNIILYLCTLEILPIILIMMLIKNVGINLDLG